VIALSMLPLLYAWIMFKNTLTLDTDVEMQKFKSLF